jgi:hypothetical protein
MSFGDVPLSRRRALGAALGSGVALAAAPVLAGCAPSKGAPASPPSPIAQVAADGWDFTANGKRFSVYGMNWMDPGTGYWPPRQWSDFSATRVDQELAQVASIGVDTIRVFVAATYFEPTPTAVSTQALKTMDTFLGIAERHGLRVQFTTPADWEGTPSYRQPDKFAGTPNLDALRVYWTAVGKTFGDDERIFSWDLHNEGTINWTSSVMTQLWPQWLQTEYKTVSAVQEAWGSSGTLLSFIDAPVPSPNHPAAGSRFLYDYQRFRESVAENFLQVQLDALKSAGDKHLTTMGLIQWSIPLYLSQAVPSQYSGFDPVRVGKNLDYITFHFYPLLQDGLAVSDLSAWVEANILYMKALAAYVATGQGKKPRPVVVGEFGWPGSGAAGRGAAPFFQGVINATPKWFSGWMPWTYAVTPTHPREWNLFNYPAGTLTPWGETYKEGRAALQGAATAYPHAPVVKAPASPTFEDMVTNPNVQYLWEFAAAVGLGSPPSVVA